MTMVFWLLKDLTTIEHTETKRNFSLAQGMLVRFQPGINCKDALVRIKHH
jgi:hypothetical protein